MESRTKNRKSREQIASMAARAFAGAGLASGEDAVAELKEGWFNVVYDLRLADGREVILKIAPPADAEILTYERNIMETEVSSMRLVHEHPGIPVPEIYFFDNARDLCDADYFFMEKLRGDNLAHVKSDLPPAVRANIECRIGEILRDIHGFTGTYFGYPGNRDLRSESWTIRLRPDRGLRSGRRLQERGGLWSWPRRDPRRVLKHAPALEAVATPRLVHWDAWDPNFFVSNGK